MFYYYFRSKQDIYLATLEQFLSERIEKRCSVLEDENIPFEEKRKTFHCLLQEDLAGYMSRYQQSSERSISDDSYKLWDFMLMLNRLIGPYTGFILQGLRERKIPEESGITKDNAEAFATFFLYGAWGMIYNRRFTEGKTQFTLKEVYEIVGSMLKPPA